MTADSKLLDELLAVRQERDLLTRRLETLESERESVSPQVFQRVRDDYERRLQELEDRAEPLRREATVEYRSLRESLGRVEDELQEIALAKEEIELRARLGELAEDELESRGGEVDERLRAKKDELRQLEEVRKGFLAAVEREEELLAGGEEKAAGAAREPAPEAAEEPPVEEPSAEEPAAAATTADLAPPEAPPPAAETAAPGPADDGKTVLRPAPSPPAPPDDGATRLLAIPDLGPGGAETEPHPGGGAPPAVAARLEPEDESAGLSVFELQSLTTIGRLPENQVRLDHRTVSRRHAQIAYTGDAFVVRDLGSDNGTFVNGEGVEERAVEDGDRLQFGVLRFVFRTG